MLPLMGSMALQCNPAGRITRIVRDDAGALGESASGKMLSSIAIPSASAHMFELLGHLEEHPVVCGWMLELGSPDEPVVYHSAAARDDELVVLVGTDAPLEPAAVAGLLAGEDARVVGLGQRMAERLASPAALVHDLRCQVAALQYQTRSPHKLENELVRVAAHDLRNPLLVVSMNCSFLLHDCEVLSDEQRALLTDTLQTSEYMTRYLDGMTSLAELWVGKLELEREPTDLEALVRYSAERNADSARRRDIAIVLRRAEPIVLAVDARRLCHVLDQVFSNIMKFCPSGTGASVELFQGPGQVVIRIEDDGPGMTADVQKKLFRPFGKTHADTTLPQDYGAGVGLAIARRLIEAHGGHIDVDSEEGRGTRVTIALPM
jgi:signal transduction histidine kinase